LCTARAFDLLTLPFPDEGAEAVIARFDDTERLADVLITYRSGFGEYYPEPAQLAFHLEEHGVKGQEGPKAVGLRSHSYHFGEVECAVCTVVHGAGVGAFVRLGVAKETPTVANLSRDFGGAHLDRTFEHNRVRLAPEQRGETALTLTA